MCGIVYSKSLVGKPVNRSIKTLYLAQRHRGSDGFGYYVPETNRLTHNPREGRILSLLRREKKASEVLFHHRMPTSTMNVRNACHPFSTKDYFEHNYIVVHNGILWNEDELRREHDALGYQYVSDQKDGSYNDSESLAYDIARYLEGHVQKLSAAGSIAMIAIKRDHKGKALAVYFGRNTGNPLMMRHTRKEFSLSSEGKGILIDPNTMYCFDYKTKTLTREPCIFPQITSSRTYSGEYVGYGYGYDWDNDGLEEEYYIGGQKMDRAEREKYFTDADEEQGERSNCKAEKEALLYESNYVVEDAIEIGEYAIESMKKRRSLIDSKMIADTATNDEEDAYYSLDNDIYYTQLAVDELRREVSGLSQMGFHYSPDNSIEVTAIQDRFDTYRRESARNIGEILGENRF